MREKFKKYGKALLAVVLTLSMVLQYWSGISFRSEAETTTGSYRELTVSDWGIIKGAYENGTAYSLTDTSITTLDGTAFTAMLNYGSANDFRIGGGGWAGLMVYFSGDNIYFSNQTGSGSGEYGVSVAGVSKSTTFKLRMTFEQDTTNNAWNVGVWLNDAYVNTYTFSGMTLGTNLLINGAGMTITDAVRGYKELTISDWGITDGVYENGTTYTLADTTITTLDGTAFTTMLNYGSANDFRIGGGGWAGLMVYFSGDNIYFSNQTGSGSGEFGISIAGVTKSSTFKLRMTFNKDVVNNAWKVGVWVNDIFQQQLTFAGMNLQRDLLVNGAGMSITDAAKEVKNLTFSDWGIIDGVYTAGETYSLQNGLTSLNGTIFEGNIAKGTGSNIRFGGASNAWAGILIYGDGNSLKLHSQIAGYEEASARSVSYASKNLSMDSFKLKLKIDYDVDNNVVLGVWIDDEFQRYITYTSMATAFGTKILMDSAGLVLSDATDEATEVVLNDITWGNFGITNWSEYTVASWPFFASTTTSLVDSSFRGKVRFDKANMANGSYLICYGSTGEGAWDGLRVKPNADGTIILEGINASGESAFSTTVTPTQDFGITNFLGTTFELGIDLITSGTDLNVFLYINGEKYNAEPYVWAGATEYIGSYVNFILDGCDANDSIIVGEKTTLTSGDWDIFGCDEYEEYTKASWPFFVSTTTSLVNSSFNGKVKFHKEDMSTGTYMICYGSTGEGAWDGLRVKPNADGTLTFQGINAEGGEAFSVTVDLTSQDFGLTSIFDTTFDLRIDLAQAGSDLKVAIYINGVRYNDSITNHTSSFTWPGAAGYVGTYVNFITDGCDAEDVIAIGEKVILTDIDWETFGLGKYQEYVTGCYPYFASTSSSLVNTSFRGKVLFEKEDMTQGTYRIAYGSTIAGEWNGLNIIPNANGTLTIEGLKTDHTGVFSQIIDPSTKELGVTKFLGETFELGIDLVASGTDLKVYVYINGVQYNTEGYVWTGAKDYVGTYVNFLMDGCDTSDLIIIGEEQPIEQLPTDFMEITLNDFGIADGTYSGVANQSLVVNGVTDLDRKFLSADISLNSGKFQIFYGKTTDAYDGLYFLLDRDANTITLNYNYVFTAAKGGFDLTSDNLVNLKITTEFINDDNGESENDVKVGVFINGVLYDNKYIVLNDYTTSMSSYVLLQQWNAEDFLTISNPKRLLPTDYEQMTLSDVGMSDVDNKNQGGVSLEEEQIDWDGLIFSGKAKLSEDCEIRFDSYVGWEGVQFEMTNDKLVFNDAIGRFSGNLATWDDVNAGELFSFSIATKYLDLDGDGADDMKLGLWVNGEMYGNRWFYILNYKQDRETKAVSYNMFSDGSSDALWCSLYSYYPSTESGSYDNGKYYYNVNEVTGENKGGYLLSTSGSIQVNGVVKSNGDVLQTPGDYNIVRTEGNTEYNTTVVIWSYGDAHPDGEMSVADLVAVKKAVKEIALTTDSGLKGADITKDGSVNDADLTLVRDVLLGKATLDDSYTNTALSYATGDSKVMPIGGFWGPYGSLLTDDIFAKIKASGINLLTYSTETYGVGDETTNVLNSLALAEKQGISMFIRDNNLANETYTSAGLAQQLASYSMYKSFKGFTGIDEPSASDSTYGKGATGYLNEQNELASSVNSYANLTHYINLYPLDSTSYGDATAYANYLEEYCNTYNPKMLSFDDYPFNGSSTTVSNCGDYFENLAIVRRKAIDNNIPFWTFVQSGVWKGTSAWLSPSMTEGEMKWNANIALAFGAKGIQYFPVVNPSAIDSSANWMASGLLDTSGNETTWYTYAKKINAQIASVDEVLMNSTNEGIMLNGKYAENSISDCGVPILTKYNEVTGITSNDTSTIEYGAVAGCFDYNGKTALYVVNYNTNGTNNVTLTFSESCTTKKITSEGVSEATGNTLNVNLAAGEAALIVID